MVNQDTVELSDRNIFVTTLDPAPRSLGTLDAATPPTPSSTTDTNPISPATPLGDQFDLNALTPITERTEPQLSVAPSRRPYRPQQLSRVTSMDYLANSPTRHIAKQNRQLQSRPLSSSLSLIQLRGIQQAKVVPQVQQSIGTEVENTGMSSFVQGSFKIDLDFGASIGDGRLGSEVCGDGSWAEGALRALDQVRGADV